MDMLKDWKDKQDSNRQKLGDRWRGEDFIFIQWDGKQMDVDTPYRAFKRIIDRYNAGNENKLPNITLHGLRHSFATFQIAGGIDIRTVSGRLGHSNASTTLNIYTHFLEENERKATACLENLLHREE